MKRALLRFDGSGKIGAASAGIVLTNDTGETITHAGILLGDETNNVAEATGLSVGLQLALAHGITHLTVQGDSDIILAQAFGTFSSSGRLGELAAASRDLRAAFEHFTYGLIPRERNAAADTICHAVQDGWWLNPGASHPDGRASLRFILSLRMPREQLTTTTSRNTLKKYLVSEIDRQFPLALARSVNRTNAGVHDFGNDHPSLITYLVRIDVGPIVAADPARRRTIEEQLSTIAHGAPSTIDAVVTRISG